MNTAIKRLALCWLTTLVSASGGFCSQWLLDVEAGAAFTGYNDVRIPSDSGSFFSLANEIVSRPAPALRLRFGTTRGRHTVSALAAPLTVRGQGTLDRDLLYHGKRFPAGTSVNSSYRFDSYRLTYRYLLRQGPRLRLGTGLTAKVRSADITLMSDSAFARRSDLGVVPLINFMAEYHLGRKAGLLAEGDALWSPYGRAEDVLVAWRWSPADNYSFRLGYRVLEGGADGGGKVYTFSLFHYLSAGVTVEF
jgi:hypothetical protein